jgi:deoxycytidylate deaminase/dephospho-CoA kinase
MAVEAVASRLQVDLTNFTTDMAVIGFTGALGSGCSYLAKGLARHHNYIYCSLSKPIHDYAQSQGKAEATDSLQNIGNDLRRQFGLGYLVGVVLTEVSKSLPAKGDAKRPVGIVVDGIRNIGEVEALQQLLNFYLISVQADTEFRKQRTIGPTKRFANVDQFTAADARDRDEHTDCGQQIKACNYLADIIIINEKTVSAEAEKPYREYIRDLLYDNYVSLIEHVAKGKLPNERIARPEEALMTTAYVESKRSSCLKRKVGAVIASSTGDIISAGHNEVPDASDPCIDDPRYGWCARDVVQEQIGREIGHCPSCGEPIIIKNTCKCGAGIVQFSKRCPNCSRSVEIDYTCPKCKKSVFAEFLPGGGSDKTGKLLDICRALHAEENAILNLAKFGVRLPTVDKRGKDAHNLADGCVLYSTTFPCNLCANKIVTVGIRKVVYAEPYTMEEAKKVFETQGVIIQRFQGVKSRAFFRLYA